MILERLPRSLSPFKRGEAVSITAGGHAFRVPRRLLDQTGINGHAVVYINEVTGSVNVCPPTRQTRRFAYSCKTGRVASTGLVRAFGFVPHTVFAPATVESGCVKFNLHAGERREDE